MDELLANDILDLLNKNCSYEELLAVINRYKNRGGNHLTAYRTLEEIRSLFANGKEEEKEDLILEIMDIVSGFCNPKQYI